MSNASFAKDHGHLISGSANSNLSFRESNNSYEGIFNLNFGYDYAFDSGIQIGGVAGTAFSSGYRSYFLLLGPTYNFNKEEIENSFFVGLKAGLRSYHFTNYSNTYALINADAGKRFRLTDSISYVPGVEISKNLDDSSENPTLTFQILRFTLVF